MQIASAASVAGLGRAEDGPCGHGAGHARRPYRRGVSDPGTLRAEAARLRRDAAALRTAASTFGEDVRTVRARYPLPSPSLWQGTAATRFADGLHAVAGEVDRIAADVTGYAEHCERLASAREGEAQRLEDAARAAGGVPG